MYTIESQYTLHVGMAEEIPNPTSRGSKSGSKSGSESSISSSFSSSSSLTSKQTSGTASSLLKDLANHTPDNSLCFVMWAYVTQCGCSSKSWVLKRSSCNKAIMKINLTQYHSCHFPIKRYKEKGSPLTTQC